MLFLFGVFYLEIVVIFEVLERWKVARRTEKRRKERWMFFRSSYICYSSIKPTQHYHLKWKLNTARKRTLNSRVIRRCYTISLSMFFKASIYLITPSYAPMRLPPAASLHLVNSLATKTARMEAVSYAMTQ